MDDKRLSQNWKGNASQSKQDEPNKGTTVQTRAEILFYLFQKWAISERRRIPDAEIHAWVRTSLVTLKEIPSFELEKAFTAAWENQERAGIPSDRHLISSWRNARTIMGKSSPADPKDPWQRNLVSMMKRRLEFPDRFSKREIAEAEIIISRGYGQEPELDVEKLNKLRIADTDEILNRTQTNPEYPHDGETDVREYTDTLNKNMSF